MEIEENGSVVSGVSTEEGCVCRWEVLSTMPVQVQSNV